MDSMTRSGMRLAFVVALFLGNISAQADIFPFDPMRAIRPQLLGGKAMQPHPSIVRVTAEERVGTSNGSGSLVDVRGDYGLVVTNWHVVRDSTGEITVVFPDGFRSAAKLLKADKDWDLAALAILRPKTTPIRIASQAPRLGDSLTIAGYGKGDYRAVTGKCTQYVSPGRSHPYEMLEVSVQARNGDSGGPILNEQGELAGVLFGAGSGSTSGSYCGRVRWFLESIWPNVGSGADSQFQYASNSNGAQAPSDAAVGNTTAGPSPSSTGPGPGNSIANSAAGVSAPRLVAVDQPRGTIDVGADVDYEGSRSTGDSGESNLFPHYSAPPERFSANTNSGGIGMPAPFALRDLVGTTTFEQGKIFLAIVGLLAILSKLSQAFATE